MTNAVYFAEPGLLAGLGPGSRFRLTGPEARHAATVKRVTAGEALDIADGAGLRLSCTVVDSAGAELLLEVHAVDHQQRTGPEVVLVQALAKGDRDLLAVETATELGIDAVVPWQSERSIVRWRADKAAKGQSKWESAVRAAAKQSRRAVVPPVLEVVELRGLQQLVRGADLSIVLHEEAATGVPELLNGLPRADGEPRRLLLIVGPEGGISPREIEALEDAGARTALLGTSVLRSSTAGPAALVLVNHCTGRWL